MLTLVLLCFLASVGADDELCDERVFVDGDYYDKHVLLSDIDRPYQFSIDKEANTLFFSYSIGSEDDDVTKLAYIDLKDNRFADIPGVEGGFATAVDQSEGTVYLGGDYGVNIFNKTSKTAVLTKAQGKNIIGMFFKDNLFVIDFPKQQLYEIKGDRVDLVPEFADLKNLTFFAIDQDGTRFYAFDTGLWALEKNASHASVVDDTFKVRAIALDSEGKAYFCGENGIFTVQPDNGKHLAHIADIDDTFSMAFDKDDNIVYATSNQIIKLMPSKKNCTNAV